MIAVAGVDPATHNLGLALPDGSTVTINARAKASDPVRRLAQLERELAGRLATCPPHLVVVEGYALGTPGRLALVRLGEVGGMVRTVAFRLGAEVVEVAPTALKRFATGHGTADKPAMIAAAIATGARLSGATAHDEADAYLLRRVGLIGEGIEDPRDIHEMSVAAAHRWPVLVPGLRR